MIVSRWPNVSLSFGYVLLNKNMPVIFYFVFPIYYNYSPLLYQIKVYYVKIAIISVFVINALKGIKNSMPAVRLKRNATPEIFDSDEKWRTCTVFWNWKSSNWLYLVIKCSSSSVCECERMRVWLITGRQETGHYIISMVFETERRP